MKDEHVTICVSFSVFFLPFFFFFFLYFSLVFLFLDQTGSLREKVQKQGSESQNDELHDAFVLLFKWTT